MADNEKKQQYSDQGTDPDAKGSSGRDLNLDPTISKETSANEDTPVQQEGRDRDLDQDVDDDN